MLIQYRDTELKKMIDILKKTEEKENHTPEEKYLTKICELVNSRLFRKI